MKSFLLVLLIASFLVAEVSGVDCYECRGEKECSGLPKKTCETDYDSVCYNRFVRDQLVDQGCMKKDDLYWKGADPGKCSMTQEGRYCSCDKDLCNYSAAHFISVDKFLFVLAALIGTCAALLGNPVV